MSCTTTSLGAMRSTTQVLRVSHVQPFRSPSPFFHPGRPMVCQSPKAWSSPSPSKLSFYSTSTDHATDPSVNPPASTRPPPLEVPDREPNVSTFSHLFKIGKAYVQFYKTGLKNVLTNRTLSAERLAALPQNERPSLFRPRQVPSTFTRADWLLFWRARHDIIRLPAFGLVLLVCGEFTPLVVIVFDGLVPYTCRIPRQIGKALERAEERRSAAFQDLYGRSPDGILSMSPSAGQSVARAHVLRSLHLIGNIWDRVGITPSWLWSMKGDLQMAYLEVDNKLLLQSDGGVSRLEPEEVKLACIDRGINVLGRKDGELRQRLGDWLRLTAVGDAMEQRKRITVLLTTPENQWPKTPEFALPEWHL
jgi:hypothetical protein